MPGHSVSIQNSIVTRLLKVTFSIYLIVTISVTLLHIGTEYLHTKKNINEELQAFEHMFAPVLAKTIWHLDNDQLRTVIKGIIQSPIVKGIKIEDEYSRLIIASGIIINDEGRQVIADNSTSMTFKNSQNSFSKMFEYKFILSASTYQNYEFHNYKVGEVTLYSDSSVIFRHVKVGYFMIIMNAIIKTIALWVFFLLAGRVLLSRPLSKFTSAIEQINLNNLKDCRINISASEHNEIWILKNAFNKMIKKLNQSIDRREDMEKAIRRSEKRYRALAENSSDYISQYDRELRYIYVNAAAKKSIGLTDDNIIGKTHHEINIFPAEVSAKLKKKVQLIFDTGEIQKEQFEIQGIKGRMVLDWQGIPEFSDTGEVITVLGVSRDITEQKISEEIRKKSYDEMEKTVKERTEEISKSNKLLKWEIEKRWKAEEALQEQLYFLQTLLDSIPVPVYYKDLKGSYLGCNKAFESFIGLPRDSIIAKSVYDIYEKKFADKYYEKDINLFEESGKQFFEYSFQSFDGKISEVIFNKATFSNMNGVLSGIVGAITDVTELKTTQKSLQKSERTARALLNATTDAVTLVDAEGILLDMNDTFAEYFKKQKKEIAGECLWSLLHPGIAELVKEKFRHVVKNGTPDRIINRYKDIWFDISVYPVCDENSLVRQIAVFARNVTDVKQAEIESRKQEILDSAIEKISFVDQDVIHFVDKDMRILWASKAAAMISNHPPESLTGRKCYKMFWNKDMPCEGCPIMRTRESGNIERSVMKHYRIKGASAETYWEKYSIPLKNKEDGSTTFVLISRNITEQVKAEKALKKSEKKLRFLTNRLLTVQEEERKRISLGLHDELGQSLAVLKLHLNSVIKKLGKDQSGRKYELIDILQYTDEIIENVRRLSRDLNPSVLDDLGLTSALRWLIEGYADNFKIRTVYEFTDLDTIFSDAHKIIIYRIFQEIFNNIRKHARTSNVRAAIDKQDDNIFFEIEDYGQGFDTKAVEDMNAADKGLGLAAMEERIRMLDGNINISSKKGKGTCIRFTIPVKGEKF